MIHHPTTQLIVTACLWVGVVNVMSAADFDFHDHVQPLLQQYCVRCHGGDDVQGDVDFVAIKSADDVTDAFELWEDVVGHLQAGTMPPEDEAQPTDPERQLVISWYRQFMDAVKVRPAVFRPRRLSVVEYRNTLKSVFGFDLEVAIMEAEQTVAERSLVVKLLPTDPPGKSGFKNDTHANPLTTVVWDQYSYLTDAAIEQLFSKSRRTELAALIELTGVDLSSTMLSVDQAKSLLETIIAKAQRRPLTDETRTGIAARLQSKPGSPLIDAVKFEIKATLMSPQFMFRGLLLGGEAGQRQAVDNYELAERVSYFFWGDMPDDRLMTLASNGTLTDSAVLATEVDRLLASPRARHLSDVFATEWLTLNEIEHVSDDVPRWVALKSQPLDFMHYLFTENRPLLELIDSDTEFINPHTARMYGGDAKQMTKYVKQKGIEVEIVANQKITLKATTERGGILTMPGILAMNKGPILRGTWMLERILGEELPEPPANVGQVPPNKGGQTLTFRERFEQHRSNPTCAVCHDKVDPLGFALESFGDKGEYLARKPDASIDTSGQLPSGETFDDFAQLKQILTTTQRAAVIRNMVERTLSFALCRKLTIYDRPEVDKMTQELSNTNGTWRDLFLAVVNSVPFRETILPE